MGRMLIAIRLLITCLIRLPRAYCNIKLDPRQVPGGKLFPRKKPRGMAYRRNLTHNPRTFSKNVDAVMWRATIPKQVSLAWYGDADEDQSKFSYAEVSPSDC